MSEQRDKAVRGLAKFLNPDTLRGNLIKASLFIAAYQTFRTNVVDRLRGFFTNGFDASGPVLDPEYQTKVLALDKSPLQATLLWLKGMSAIDDADIADAHRAREHRNALSHKLQDFLLAADLEIDLGILESLCKLLAKIDRWWIREVEMTTNPDFDGVEVADEDITSGTMWFLSTMMRIAYGEDSAEYWEDFRNRVVPPA